MRKTEEQEMKEVVRMLQFLLPIAFLIAVPFNAFLIFKLFDIVHSHFGSVWTFIFTLTYIPSPYIGVYAIERVININYLNKLAGGNLAESLMNPFLFIYYLSMSLAILFGYLISASMIFHAIDLLWGGFTNDLSASSFDWMMYCINWFVNTITFNAPDIFNWTITNINPISLNNKIITLVLNVSLDIVFIASISKSFRFRKNKG